MEEEDKENTAPEKLSGLLARQDGSTCFGLNIGPQQKLMCWVEMQDGELVSVANMLAIAEDEDVVPFGGGDDLNARLYQWFTNWLAYHPPAHNNKTMTKEMTVYAAALLFGDQKRAPTNNIVFSM